MQSMTGGKTQEAGRCAASRGWRASRRCSRLRHNATHDAPVLPVLPSCSSPQSVHTCWLMYCSSPLGRTLHSRSTPSLHAVASRKPCGCSAQPKMYAGRIPCMAASACRIQTGGSACQLSQFAECSECLSPLEVAQSLKAVLHLTRNTFITFYAFWGVHVKSRREAISKHQIANNATTATRASTTSISRSRPFSLPACIHRHPYIQTITKHPFEIHSITRFPVSSPAQPGERSCHSPACYTSHTC